MTRQGAINSWNKPLNVLTGSVSILSGGAMCMSGFACVAGAPLIALGINDLHSAHFEFGVFQELHHPMVIHH